MVYPPLNHGGHGDSMGCLIQRMVDGIHIDSDLAARSWIQHTYSSTLVIYHLVI